MSVQITRHVMHPEKGVEIVDLIDSHGRTHQIQAPILNGPPTQEFIDKCVADFEAQEEALAANIPGRFDPVTLERLPQS